MTDKYYPAHVPYPITLIGCGGIGSNLAPLLAKTGTPRLELWDDDTVAPVNLQAQMFDEMDIGRPKAFVLQKRVRRMRPLLEVAAHPRRITREESLDGIVISGVDSMKSRADIFDAVLRNRQNILLYLDARLSRANPRFCELFAIDPKDPWQGDEYGKWIELDADTVHEERPKTFSAHTPVILSGIIGEVLSRWSTVERWPWRTTFDGTIPHMESYYV